MTDVIDEVRAFWDRRPCNIRHSPAPVGTPQYFDEVEARKYFVEPHIPGFAEFKRWKSKKVLEIGCGIGTDSTNFARAGAHLTCVDISSESLRICRERLQAYGLSALLYCGNAEELSTFVPCETYDLVYSFGAIHHTPHPHMVIEQIKKYCGPWTELRLMLYSKYSWKGFWIVCKYGRCAFWRARNLLRIYSEAESGCPVTHCYSFRDVRELLRDFTIRGMRKDHIFPYVVEDYVCYHYRKVLYFRWMPTVLFRALERRLGWHTLIVAKPKAWSEASRT